MPPIIFFIILLFIGVGFSRLATKLGKGVAAKIIPSDATLYDTVKWSSSQGDNTSSLGVLFKQDRAIVLLDTNKNEIFRVAADQKNLKYVDKKNGIQVSTKDQTINIRIIHTNAFGFSDADKRYKLWINSLDPVTNKSI